MNTTSSLKRTLQTLLITGISILALAHAADAPKVTANNYVRADSDIQKIGYIKSYNNFGKFEHFRKGFPMDNHFTVLALAIIAARHLDADWLVGQLLEFARDDRLDHFERFAINLASEFIT